MTKAEGVVAFMERLDAVARQYLDAYHADGHPDLKEYDPTMGPRYAVKGFTMPLSVFRGEGIALYLIADALRPRVIAECYTGTGYAACCLAAGASDADVYTVDNYTEGGLGEVGARNALAIRDALGLVNLRCLRGDTHVMRQSMSGPAQLYFSDGPYGEAPVLMESAVHIRHDDTQGRVDGRSFLIEGGSHMGVTCPTIEMRDWLMGEVSPFVKVRAI